MQRSISVVDDSAKSACVWIIGEYGASLPDAPYILEDIALSYAQHADSVKLQLLTASLKLFFKRPSEMKPVLSRVFELSLEDGNVDVHDRALLYYRLIEYNLNQAKAVIAGPKDPIDAFVSIDEPEELMHEFNTLSVVYGKLASSFVVLEREPLRCLRWRFSSAFLTLSPKRKTLQTRFKVLAQRKVSSQRAPICCQTAASSVVKWSKITMFSALNTCRRRSFQAQRNLTLIR